MDFAPTPPPLPLALTLKVQAKQSLIDCESRPLTKALHAYYAVKPDASIAYHQTVRKYASRFNMLSCIILIVSFITM